MLNRIHRVALIAGLCALFMAAGTFPVFADSPSTGGDITVAQSLGDRELTVVLRRVTSVPGPLRVDVITHQGTAPGSLALAVTPTGSSTGSSPSPAPGVHGMCPRLAASGLLAVFAAVLPHATSLLHTGTARYVVTATVATPKGRVHRHRDRPHRPLQRPGQADRRAGPGGHAADGPPRRSPPRSAAVATRPTGYR